MPRARFATLTGWLLFLAGVTVIVGWRFRWPVWAYVNPGGIAMVFNTALCLTLGGIALALPSLRIKSVERVRTTLGGVIVAIGAAALAENFFSIDLGLDWPSLHRWFSDSNPFPGRMAPNTALAMFIAGIPLALGGKAGANSTGGVLRRVLPAAAIAIGVLGLTGHAFQLDLAYDWYGFPRMALPAGMGIVVFGLGLLFDSYAATDAQVREASGEIRIYAFLGVAMTILVAVAVISYGSINGLLDRIRWVEHTYQVRVEFEDVMDAYDRARSGWRTFILDNDAASASEFQQTAMSLPRQIHDVMELTADNPRQQARLAAIRHLIEEDIATLEEVVRRRQQEGPGVSADVLSTVKLDVAQTNAAAAEFRAEQNELLAQRQRESQRSSRSAVLIMIAGNAGGFALLIYTFWILKRHNDQRTRSAQQSAHTNAFLDSLFENIPAMLSVKDARELRFLRFNKAGEALLGLSRDKLIGKSDYDFFPEQEADIFTAKDRAVLAGGQLVEIPEESIHTRRQGIRILHTVKIPILDAEGISQYLLGISQDITERRHAEDEIRALNSTLKLQTERLETANKELESFSYSVSHDLRAPLRAIDGFALMLLEDCGGRLDSEGLRYLDVIRGNATRMGALIDDLLTLSRLGRLAVKKTLVDMDQLVGEVVRESLETHGDKAPKIEVGPLPAANADRALMRQVWVNLISNAIKYSGKSPAPTIEVSGHQGAAEYVYAVKDNGAGFSMEYYDKLFGVFQRLHRADEFTGTGVGLAIVQRLVTRHGGRVWAQGEENKGAEFFFTLPTGENDERV